MRPLGQVSPRMNKWRHPRFGEQCERAPDKSAPQPHWSPLRARNTDPIAAERTWDDWRQEIALEYAGTPICFSPAPACRGMLPRYPRSMTCSGTKRVGPQLNLVRWSLLRMTASHGGVVIAAVPSQFAELSA